MEDELLNKIIFGKYKIIYEIGKGQFSSVFSSRNIINQNYVALKIQEKSKKIESLKKEAYYLFQLKGGEGIPKIISFGYSGKYEILIEQLLGKSLLDLFKGNNNKKSRLKDMIMVSIQLIERIQFIHSKYLLHLDIKPNNFLIGNPDSSLIYVIDFGFAKKYRSSRTGKHAQYSKKSYFNGNLKYSSVRTMNGIEPSRRDDLESLGYMLIYLYNLKLPWNNLCANDQNDLAQKIYEFKKDISLDSLCQDTPKEIKEYMKYVKSLKFEEEPNYEYLKNIFLKMLQKYENQNYFHFSWVNELLIKKVDYFSSNKSSKRRRVSPFIKLIENKKSNSVFDINIDRISIKDKSKNIEDKDKEHLKIKKNENLTTNNGKGLSDNSRYNIKENRNFKNIIINDEINTNKNNEKMRRRIDFNLIDKKFKKKDIFFKNFITEHTSMKNSFLENPNIYYKKKLSYINNLKNNSNISSGKKNYKSNKNYKNINYNFVIKPYISNKTINIFSNNQNKEKIYFYNRKMNHNILSKKKINKFNSTNNINKYKKLQTKIIYKKVNKTNNNINLYKYNKFFYSRNLKNLENLQKNFFSSNINYKRRFCNKVEINDL